MLPQVPLTQGLMRFVANSFNHYEDLSGFLAEHVALSQDSVLPFFIPILAYRYPRSAAKQLQRLLPSRRIISVILAELQLQQEEFVGWRFEDVLFDRAQLTGVTFHDCVFAGGGFYDSVFLNVRFENCRFDGVEFSSVVFDNAKFVGSDFNNEKLPSVRFNGMTLVDDEARAYLRYRGARIAPERHLNTWTFHPQWRDFAKVVGQLTEDLGAKQELGLVKKGGISDTKWSQGVVNVLVSAKLCERGRRGGKYFVRVVPGKMDVLTAMLHGHLPPSVAKHFGRK